MGPTNSMVLRDGSPAQYTVQVFSQGGVTKVIGVADYEKRNELVAYIRIHEGEKKSGDWFRFLKDKEIDGVVNEAKKLDPGAEVFNVQGWVYIHVNCDVQPVDSASRAKTEVEGTYVVLYYVSTQVYKVTVVEKPLQREVLINFITDSGGIEETNWYRLKDIASINKIVNEAKEIGGVTYEMVRG